MYFTPSVNLPPFKVTKNHYAVVGTSYMSIVEFTDRVKSKSVLLYGASGDKRSPHFFDQAPLMSKKEMKDNPIYWDEVTSSAKRTYHPGEEPTAAAQAAK
jgi:hypothetical protein